MVNEEDHLRIQSMGSGLSLTDTLARAMRIDDDLAERWSSTMTPISDF